MMSEAPEAEDRKRIRMEKDVDEIQEVDDPQHSDEVIHDRRHEGPDWKRTVGVVVGVVGVLIGMLSWAFASPMGSAPDEDYHLASIWCPRPSEGSGCAYQIEDGVIAEVVVPESIAKISECVWGDMNRDSACVSGYSDSVNASTARFDDGGYPWGYYQINHVLVGPDVERSVLNMRLMNTFIGVGALFLVGALASRKVRHDLLVSAAAAWVPMGVYFVASVNPSSWSITGVLIFGSALYVATQSQGTRRYLALALSAFGALLCVFSRGDAAFFVLVVTLATWILIPIAKEVIVPLVYSAGASLIGLVVMTTAGQGNNLRGDGGWASDNSMSFMGLIGENFFTLPEHVGRYWDLVSWGGPWLDVPVTGWSTITMVMVAGGVVFAGLSVMYWRKGLAVSVLLVALLGIPVVSLAMRQVYPAQQYHGRYMLPLLAVLFLFLLANKTKEQLFGGTAQVLVLAVVVGAANGFAMQRVLRKHLVGLDGRGLVGFLTFGEPAWWPWSIPPEIVFWGGSIAFTVGMAVLLLLTSSRQSQEVELSRR